MYSTTVQANLSRPEGEMVFDVGSLRAYLHQVTDPRDPRGVRYRLVDLLTLLILAKLARDVQRVDGDQQRDDEDHRHYDAQYLFIPRLNSASRRRVTQKKYPVPL